MLSEFEGCLTKGVSTTLSSNGRLSFRRNLFVRGGGLLCIEKSSLHNMAKLLRII